MQQKIVCRAAFVGSTRILGELFTIIFENNTVLIEEFNNLHFETEIFQNDNEIFIFFIERDVYRLRIYISNKEKITGDLRVRIGYQDWCLLAFLKSEDKLNTNSLSIKSISSCKHTLERNR
jgi:hypothetical protein